MAITDNNPDLPNSLASRFWAKVERPSPTACWKWRATKNPGGYGMVHYSGHRMVLAHRAAWELTNGQIPDGLDLCHKCDVRDCVNPAHLFVGSVSDNMRDAVTKGRYRNGKELITECPRGHPYDDANTRLKIDRNGHKHRECRACDRLAHRRKAA